MYTGNCSCDKCTAIRQKAYTAKNEYVKCINCDKWIIDEHTEVKMCSTCNIKSRRTGNVRRT